MTKKFTFDRAFGPDSKQADVYQVVVAPLINEVLSGYNCTVFAYGQTGTGKTHTMIGDETPQSTSSYEDVSISLLLFLCCVFCCCCLPIFTLHIFNGLFYLNFFADVIFNVFFHFLYFFLFHMIFLYFFHFISLDHSSFFPFYLIFFLLFSFYIIFFSLNLSFFNIRF